MKESVLQVLRDHCCLKEGSRLVLAVSGGPDSICLLDLLKDLKYQISVAHLNHQLRVEADHEAEFVKKRSEFLGFPFFLESADVKGLAEYQKIGVEEAARNTRYKFLFETAEKTDSLAVITAHHADDQVETVLMNLIRGAGLNGLAGMSYCQTSRFHARIPLVRPLLDFWKEEILSYCASNQLDFFIDPSNLTGPYFRNRIRNHLLPILMEYNPNIKDTIHRTSKTIAGDLSYIQSIVEQTKSKLLSSKNNDQFSFSLEKYQALPEPIKNHFIMDVFHALKTDWTEISLEIIQQAKSALKNNDRMMLRNLGKEIFLLNEGDTVTFTKDPNLVWKDEWPVCLTRKTMEISNIIIDLSGDWQFEMRLSSIENCREEIQQNKDRLTAYLDRSIFSGDLLIRSWEHGDRFRPLGMNGQKVKLTDFWIDRKIPRRARDKWPLVIADGEIAWIPGFHPSHEFRVRETTRKILVMNLRRKS